MVETYFERGADDLASAELAAPARDPALNDGRCTVVAELLDERGDLAGAARSYDRAVARLDDEAIEGLREPDGWVSMMTGQPPEGA